eukprot:24311-Pyramimonas_sp.AAC.1
MCPVAQHVHGHVSIFVDGSSDEKKPSTAAWTMAAIAKDRAETISFLGVQTGKLLTAVGVHLDVRKLSSTSPEMAAIVWALLWIGRQQPSLAESYTIELDPASAIQIAKGAAQSEAHPELGILLRVLTQEVHATYGMSFKHVPSHQAHPWDELVDGLAKRERVASDVHDPDWASDLTPAVGDAWSRLSHEEGDRHAYPSVACEEGQLSLVTPDGAHETIDPADSLPADALRGRSEPPPAVIGDAPLAVASFNATSMVENPKRAH